MLRISKLTDYGVVLASHMAMLDGAHAARDLAVFTEIPEPTVSKVLKALTRAGVVVSQRGAKGGYALARDAREIGVQEVIEALEGPIAVTECSDDTADSSCEYETNCGVRANWQRINRVLQQALATITLADMAQPSTLELFTIARSSTEANQRRLATNTTRTAQPAHADIA